MTGVNKTATFLVMLSALLLSAVTAGTAAASPAPVSLMGDTPWG